MVYSKYYTINSIVTLVYYIVISCKTLHCAAVCASLLISFASIFLMCKSLWINASAKWLIVNVFKDLGVLISIFWPGLLTGFAAVFGVDGEAPARGGGAPFLSVKGARCGPLSPYPELWHLCPLSGHESVSWRSLWVCFSSLSSKYLFCFRRASICVNSAIPSP